jgi:sugar phosphate isomerase/epimerase
MKTPRREFIKTAAGAAAGLTLAPLACRTAGDETVKDAASDVQHSGMTEPLFKISLAQWSLHRSIFGGRPDWDAFKDAAGTGDYSGVLAGDIDPLDFARVAKQDFGIDAIEYVNTMYFDKPGNVEYLADLKDRADSEGVTSLLIMIDREGALGASVEADRIQAVEKHYRWVEMAKYLGCHSIRVNAQSDPDLSFEEQQKLAADGLRRLCEFGDEHDINVIVENHGGLSSNGSWLAGVMDLTDHPRVGTLPDFGNFRVSPDEDYDRYRGVKELMPYAKAVSAKSHSFDDEGNCVETDYRRMMQIVLDAGYHGYVGIEYEGDALSESEGIVATKALLERVRDELSV